MSAHIAVIAGSYHREEVELMLVHAEDEAHALGCSLASPTWVPVPEMPLATQRAFEDPDCIGAICLGVIERGETLHGEVMGHAVLNALIDLQLGHDRPIGVGIIGPGADPSHLPSRLEPHARSMLSKQWSLCGVDRTPSSD